MTGDVVQVRRVFRIVNGGTPTPDPDNWGGDVTWITPDDLGKADGMRITGSARTLTKQGLRAAANLVPRGSIVLSTRAPIGHIGIADRPLAFNQGCKGLVPRQELDERFFYYQLIAKRPELQVAGQGATFTELSASNLASIRVLCPPLDQQRRIADFLDDHTARFGSLVREKKRLLALLSERDAVIVSEVLGAADGVARRVGQVAVTIGGTGFPPAYQGVSGGDLPFIKVSDMHRPGANVRVGDAENWITNEVARELGARVVPAGAVIFPKVGAALLKNPRRLTSRACVVDNNVMAVVPHGLSARYLRYALLLVDFGQLANPGPVPSLTAQQVRDLVIRIPPDAAQERIADQLDRELNRQERLRAIVRQQLDVLSEHHEALITATVTGQLDRSSYRVSALTT